MSTTFITPPLTSVSEIFSVSDIKHCTRVRDVVYLDWYLVPEDLVVLHCVVALGHRHFLNCSFKIYILGLTSVVTVTSVYNSAGMSNTLHMNRSKVPLFCLFWRELLNRLYIYNICYILNLSIHKSYLIGLIILCLLYLLW